MVPRGLRADRRLGRRADRAVEQRPGVVLADGGHVHEHEDATGVQGVDVGLGGGVAEPRVHQQPLEPLGERYASRGSTNVATAPAGSAYEKA